MYTQRFPGVGAAPYVPINHCRSPYQGIAPPVTMRTAVPVFSAPPLPPPTARFARPACVAPPVRIRQAAPVLGVPGGGAASATPEKLVAMAEGNK